MSYQNRLAAEGFSICAFTLSQVDALPSRPGLYGFLNAQVLVYLGGTVDQGIRARLLQHWSRSHNPRLALWLEALAGDLLFAYKLLPRDLVWYEEDRLIRKFCPFCNRNGQPATHAP